MRDKPNVRAERVGLIERINAQDGERPARGAREQGEDAQQRGLTGTVGAKDGEEGALGHRKVNAI